MPRPYQQPSPPSSTSLPEHWQFVPPPTDGPNTRARRERGQLPYSGSSVPLPVELASRGPERRNGEASAGLVEEVNTWEAQAEQHWYSAPASGQGDSFFAMDPSLEFDPASFSFAYDDARGSYSGFDLSSNEHRSATAGRAEDRRLFSGSSVIDYGSPPASPPAVASQADEQGTRAALPRTDDLATGMGMTKEEWLRLGGFREDEAIAVGLPTPPAVPQYPKPLDDAFASLPLPGQSRSAHPLGQSSFPLPSPAVHVPLPPASAPVLSTFILPTPPALSQNGLASGFDFESDELPTPPPLQPLPPLVAASEPRPRATARASARRAPSPTTPLRPRPAPYPTSASSRTSASSNPRNHTPVSTALASYHNYPVPNVPPAPTETPAKRKSHGRRVSVNHIPRPRNAFILFRSHAVSTGLIPRSMGITDHKNISQIVGSVWRGLSDEERKKWDELAEEEKMLHREKYPDYRFAPRSRGQRAPVGQGKKAKAKAAREAAERLREDALGVGGKEVEVDEDDEGDGDVDSAFEAAPSRPRTARRRGSTSTNRTREWSDDDEVRNQRRMELIGQAVLEGEDEGKILGRVEEEMGREDAALANAGLDVRVAVPASSPAKSGRRSPTKAATPRKTRSTVQQRIRSPPSAAPPPGDILVNSPTHSASTASPSRDRASPYSTAANARRAVPSSPASSTSPSPKRMQQVGPLRGAGSPPVSGGRHPLSRSHPRPSTEDEEDDLPAARRGKKGNAYAGLGVQPSSFVLPPTPNTDADPSPTPTLFQAASPEPSFSSSSAFQQPLFAGPADNRNFSLGRWELRKPSTAAGSRREQLAQQEEEQAGSTAGWLDRAAGGNGGARIPSAFAIDPTEFLTEAGLKSQDDVYYTSTTTADAWNDGASSVSGPASSIWSGYEPSLSSVATTVSRSPRKQPLFRRDPTMPSAFLASSTGCDPFSSSPFSNTFPAAEPPPDVFHFGSVDLFARPPPALGLARSTSSAAKEDVFGLGIRFDEHQA
ncbi:hypothetical protein JCM11641_008215 [Rhodosporidiobolus odoratus]